MRPVNLIPQGERGSRGGAARTGPLVYIILGALGVLLLGVVMLVLTSNKISDHEHEIARLEAQKARVAAQTAQLTPYVDFENIAKQRIETVTALADGRFDWVRVIHQLSLILPPGSSVSNLTASSGGGSEGGVLVTTSPALNLVGCTTGQDGTAAVVAAMKQIDGVTRVGLASSSKAGEAGAGGGGEAGCPKGTTSFLLTASFDEAPQSPVVAGESVAPPPEAESESESSTSSSEEESTEGETADSSSSGTEGSG